MCGRMIKNFCVVVENTEDNTILYVLVNADYKTQAGYKAIDLVRDNETAFISKQSKKRRKRLTNIVDEIIAEFKMNTMLMVSKGGFKATHSVRLNSVRNVIDGTLICKVEDNNFKYESNKVIS